MYINVEQYLNRASVNEASFYGKNPLLLQGEKIIERMLPKLKSLNIADVVNNDLPELEKILEDVYGFDKVFLNFSEIGSHTLPAYYTASNFYLFNPKFTATKGKYGPTFNRKDGIRTYINIGLDVITAKLTAEEIMAIILHEVGHSFEFTTKGRLFCLNPLLLSIFFQTSIAKMVSKNLPEFVNFFKVVFFPFKKLWAFVIKMMNDIGSLFLFIPGIGALSLGSTILSLLGPNALELLPPILTYDREKFSDYFSTSYGYGNALESALVKLERNCLGDSIITKEGKRKTTLFGYFYAHNTYALSLASSMFAPHPRNIDRMTLAINYLKKAEKDETNKRAKDEIRIQIKEMEKLREAYLADLPEDIEEAERRNMVLFNGKISPDFRNLFTEVEDDIIRNLDVK